MISGVILTFNNEKYLAEILQRLSGVCDEIIIVDSGSRDRTEEIAVKYKCRFVFRSFDNFKNQRTYALELCKNDWVLMIDSDEIPDEALVDELKNMEVPLQDAYRIERKWIVLGTAVRAVYPITSPDYPIRLFNKSICNFNESNVVHEDLSGYKSIGVLKGTLSHRTFETKQEIKEKLERYTSLSCRVLIEKQKPLNRMQQLLSAVAAFIKWYIIKRGFLDGYVGLVLGKFAFDYTFIKYRKAREITRRAIQGR